MSFELLKVVLSADLRTHFKHLSSPQPEHTTSKVRRDGVWRGAGADRAEQDGMLTSQFAQHKTVSLAAQSIEHNHSERLYGSTNK